MATTIQPNYGNFKCDEENCKNLRDGNAKVFREYTFEGKTPQLHRRSYCPEHQEYYEKLRQERIEMDQAIRESYNN